jgi:hypothetical protein
MTVKDTIWLLAHSKEKEDQREWAVLYWKYQGYTHREVGEKLFHGKDWVQRYMTAIYKRFGAPPIQDKDEKFQWLVDNIFPALKEFLEQDSEAQKLLPPPLEQVEEEITAIELVKPAPLVPPPPPTGRKLPWVGITLIVMCLLGTVVMSVIAWKYYPLVVAIATNSVKNPLIITATPAEITQTSIPSSGVQETSTLAMPDTPQPTVIPTDTNIPPTSTATPNSVLFSDNFSSGLNPAWITVSGQPQIVQNTLTASEETWLELRNPSWNNVKITITTKSNNCWFNGPFSEIGVGDSPNNMVAFAWANCESAWGIVNSGTWQQVANSHWQGNLEDKVTYVITFKDDSYTASALGNYDTSVVLPDHKSKSQDIFFRLGRGNQIYSFKVDEAP